MENKTEGQGAQVGSMAGMGAGMLTGARLGSAVIPVPVLGTFVGAMVGGVLGSAIGQRVGEATLNGVYAFLDTLTTPLPSQQQPQQPNTPHPEQITHGEDQPPTTTV